MPIFCICVILGFSSAQRSTGYFVYGLFENVKNMIIIVISNISMYFILEITHASSGLFYSLMSVLIVFSVIWIYRQETEIVSFVKNSLSSVFSRNKRK